MTYDDAYNLLKDKFPGKYVALKFEKTFSGYKDYKSISAYVEGCEWSPDCSTFKEAIDHLTGEYAEEDNGITDIIYVL